MESQELELQVLVAKGQSQGYLTYDEINAYLPGRRRHPREAR